MTMITPSYLGETIEYSSLHACRSTLEDPTAAWLRQGKWRRSARRLGDDARALQAELDLKNARDIYRGHPLPSEPPPLPVIPPPMP